jgi:septum site-determining protein MinC
MQNSQFHKPIEIKISTVVAISVILRELDTAILDAALQEMTGGTPDFFENEFAVIDIGTLDPTLHQQIDWAALIALLKSYRLNPVAVRNAPPEIGSAIIEHGLSLDDSPKAREPVEKPDALPPAPPVAAIAPITAATTEQTASASASAPAMIIDTPVRAGQRIYARGCDLIITAVVNNGAEIIADGSIHIYAPLRGRALAGASGNASARIFALSMEPELVSIAGVYRTFEEGFPPALAHQPAQVRLIGDRIDLLSANLGAKA